MKYVAERIENGTGERPLKGLLLESTLYYVNTKQEILDEQGISQKRVANLVVYAKDVKKWLVFNSDGSSFEEKDLPSGQDLSNYIEKNSEAQLSKLKLAFAEENNTLDIFQDVNKWTQVHFTGTTQFKSKDSNTGIVGDKILEVTPTRINFVKQAYDSGGNKIASRVNNHIANTASFSNLINSENKTINEWIADNPEYTPQEFLAQIFSCKVLGLTNWVASITTSGNNYNGTFPNNFQQVEIHKTGGSSRNFIKSYNKESSTHYYYSYKASDTKIEWNEYAYKSHIDPILDDVDNINNRLDNIEIGGIAREGIENDLKLQEVSEDGYYQKSTNTTKTKILINGVAVNIINIPDDYSKSLCFGILEISKGKFWLGFHATEIIKIVGLDKVAQNSPLGIVIDAKKYNLNKQNTTTPVPSGGKMNFEGLCIPTSENANDDTPQRYIMPDGSQTTVKADAFSRDYMDWKFSQTDTHVNSLGKTQNWKYRLQRGYIDENYDFIKDSTSPHYFCKCNSTQFTLTVEKTSTITFPLGSKYTIYDSPIDANNIVNPAITDEEINFSIAENNDKILSPTTGIQNPIEDEDNSETGYGKDGNSTYFQPLNGLNQSLFLEKIDYSKIWAIHSKIDSVFINLIIHEDIVSQIFNKDFTGLNSFSMLLDPTKSKAKLGKSNQQAAEGTKISLNGDIIPADQDANNPTQWINNDGEITEDYSNIKNVTYSAGSFVNVGGTIAVRGDVSCDIENGTSTIVQDNNSKYFVIPVKAGGGTFNVLKLFPFYIARLKAIVEDYGIYFFEDNADAIGKFLEIIYQAAVENNEELEKQEELQIQSLFAFDNQNILINNLKVG